ncbi:hypothetical protein [Pontimicrobium sp. SW4]|uniref:Uncharacterized protein n=1 Tax=Pontimicrobium sp. SW4 TaxID=3153519 RepID=A0AAU7BSF9_9FLAO
MEESLFEYFNSLSNQIIVIDSLLGGFSIAVIANLLISDTNTRLLRTIMQVTVLSASFFLISLFIMTRVMMITSNGYPFEFTEDNVKSLSSYGSITLILGIMALVSMIALSGWTKSKKTGIFTTVIGILTFIFILLILF